MTEKLKPKGHVSEKLHIVATAHHETTISHPGGRWGNVVQHSHNLLSDGRDLVTKRIDLDEIGNYIIPKDRWMNALKGLVLYGHLMKTNNRRACLLSRSIPARGCFCIV